MLVKYHREIKSEMLLMVKKDFFQEHLSEIAVKSIEFKEKEGLSFGYITVLHHNMFDGTSSYIFKAAAAVELLILSFDIFDDLQDNDNAHTPWAMQNSAITMNLALSLFSLSVQIINDLDSNHHLRKTFDFLNLNAINGQHIDLLNDIENEQQYINMIALKSGSLFALAGAIGTSLASNRSLKQVLDFCTFLGIAEQLKNDLNDIFSTAKNDWSMRKKSLPILYLLENDSDSIISRFYNYELSYPELVAQKDDVKKILLDSGSILYTKAIIRKHQLLAIRQLKTMPVNKNYSKEILKLCNIN